MIGFFDSGWVHVKNQLGLIGVGIIVKSFKEIEEIYCIICDDVIRELERRGKKFKIVKSDHISKFLPRNIALTFYQRALEKTKNTCEFIISFTKLENIPEELLIKCKKYGLGKSKTEVLKKVSQFYPLITLSTTLDRFKINHAYLDEIHGHLSSYWLQVVNKTSLTIIPRGDFQYEGIALADIIATSIGIILRKSGRIDENIIRNIVKSGKFSTVSFVEIINNILIVQEYEPGARMNVAAFRPHPQLLVFPQDNIREFIEWSSLMINLYEIARRLMGFAKIFCPTEDIPYLTSDDYIILVGDTNWCNKMRRILRDLLLSKVITSNELSCLFCEEQTKIRQG